MLINVSYFGICVVMIYCWKFKILFDRNYRNYTRWFIKCDFVNAWRFEIIYTWIMDNISIWKLHQVKQTVDNISYYLSKMYKSPGKYLFQWRINIIEYWP